MIRPTGPVNHQFLPKCYKYVGHTCNGLNIPQKYSRYVAKNKENNFVNTAKLGLDFKMQMVKFGLDFIMQMAKLANSKMVNFETIIISGEIRKEFIAASGEVWTCFGYGGEIRNCPLWGV